MFEKKKQILVLNKGGLYLSIRFYQDPSYFQAEDISLDKWLSQNLIHHETVKEKAKQREVGTWIEIRLFISSTFIDTHSERDILVIAQLAHDVVSTFIQRYLDVMDVRWTLF